MHHGVPTTHAAGSLAAGPVSDTTPPGAPATGSALDRTVAPAGTTATVASFVVPGVSAPVLAGSAPVSVLDPASGAVAGSLTIQPNGTYVFVPASGFVGAVPPIGVTVVSSDGQQATMQLSLAVKPLLRDGNEDISVAAGATVRVDVLANALLPPSTTASVTSFTLPGASTVYAAGPTPVSVTDPLTGTLAGTVQVLANGSFTFTPAAAFVGQVPPITYVVTSSDGQTSPGSATICAQPGEAAHTHKQGPDTITMPLTG